MTRTDRLALAGVLAFALAVLSSGYGLHDPWPADSPRFAAVARDMLASGDWLFPRVGGDLYPDKPPVYFWLMAASMWLTGSVRAGFLLPSLLAGLGTVLLTFDLVRRLHDTRTATMAALLLAVSAQFAIQAHTAQIDGTLCFITTLGLYGFLRHLLLGPQWRWYAIAGAACGVGVITKGVGFLPLLVLPAWWLMARRGVVSGPTGTRMQWLSAPLLALAAIACWLIPMLIASAGDPALEAYRNEILFGQTVDRYVAAAGHRKPFHYHLTSVVPWAWLPLSLALPWLVPRWRDAVRARDARVIVPLAWVAIVFVFFVFSSGKRGVYILPALPATIIAAAPYLNDLLRLRWPNGLARALLVCLGVFAVAGFVLLPDQVAERIGSADPALRTLSQWTMAVLAVLAFGSLVPWPRPTPGLVRLGAFFAATWVLLGWLVMPRIDGVRSGAPVMHAARAALPAGAELGIALPKESMILHAGGPLTNFGHRRPDRGQEVADAARWLQGGASRYLVVPGEAVVEGCFDATEAIDLGYAHRRRWLLFGAAAARPECVARGSDETAIAYAPAAVLPSLSRLFATSDAVAEDRPSAAASPSGDSDR